MAAMPRTVLISGCSTGIGLELAVMLAHDPGQRYQVMATMRDLGKKGMLEAAAGEALGHTLTVAQMDVCSDESVAQCLSCIQGEVDVLVNNAGVGLVGPLEGLSLAAMQGVFDTNFFGAVRLVKAVLPGMKRRRRGHIVVVSSVMGLQGVMFNEVYAASKFALEGFFESLAIQLLEFNIYISLVEPGPVITDFERKVLEQVSTTEFPGTDPDTLRYFRDFYLPASEELFHSVGQSPQDVAQVIVKVISSARPALRKQTNARYLPLTALKAADPSGRVYVQTANRLLFHWPRLLNLGLRCLACSCLSTRVRPILRVGSPEDIHVQAHSDSKLPLTRTLGVNITVWDFPLRKTLVARHQLLLSPENHFMSQAPVTIPESLVYPPKPGQQYVIIQVNWTPASTSSFMEKPVLVAPHAGYIFIQTDKTIYNPEHLVQYRVFTVNHKLDPVSQPFTLDIKVAFPVGSPEGITVISQDVLAKEGFLASSFHLPELVSLGTWSIEASYQSATKQKFKAAFDVKEYVLPSFEVQLKPNKTFFHLNSEALGVDIHAQYVFNKLVDGNALAIFGIKLDSRQIPIQSSLQRVEISEGVGHVTLHKNMLMTAFQGPEEEFIGASIFVNVTVFSGGEMVQAEASGVKIVRSPYNIQFTRTPQYFKPGLPFHFRVFVSNPDGSPASGVFVRCQERRAHTSPAGVAVLTVDTQANMKQLPIQVKTDEPLQPEEQASAMMTAWPYSTPNESGNFLHIEVKTLGTDVGSNIQLSLNTRHTNPEVKDQISHFTILVLSKGQIVYAKHQPQSQGSVYTSAIIDVTSEMLPSFRILAFYLLPKGKGQDPELVADSVWIDVNDRCMGTLKVGLKNERFFQTFDPNSQVELKVTGDAGATVGLLAVDKAVYVLNSKHKLTQKKVWDVVEEHDIGCTAGSGKDGLAVFKDAGLDLKLSTGMDTLASSDWKCPQSTAPTRRRRSSLKRMETKRNAVRRPLQEARGCGVPVGPWRASKGGDGPRVERARDPTEGSGGPWKTLRGDPAAHGLPAADQDDDFDDIFLDDLPVRTLFPESWLWRKLTLPKGGPGSAASSDISHYVTNVNLPDSITTWQIMAVSLKAGRGLCVSEPFELTVMKTFFVDLKLPSSVIRNEQLQIQAVLYNFRDRQAKVRVEFPHKESLCSASKPTAPWRQVVVVPPTSSKTVPFVVLPLETGKVDVEVKALGLGIQDHVKKTLLVKAGGQIMKIFDSALLNPEGNTQTLLVQRQDFLNKVPGTEAEVFVSIQGDILGETILGSLTPRETGKLLTVPGGCPEQTLSSLTPVIILTRYLDATGQWGKVGVELRDQVMKNIVIGYTQMLTHRSEDGTYHTSKGNPGSTWLTSYVFRIFSLAYHTATVTVVNQHSLCAMASWLITQRQAEDGHFLDEGPPIMSSMQGGYKDSEANVSLTAFVLIALNEGKELCTQEIPGLTASMEKARGFLERHLPSIQTTFAVAITSYALALTNSPRANDRLDSFASHDKTHWPVKNMWFGPLYTIEATAYALMQKLELGRHNETHAIAKWLLEKRELGGGFKSTQTTVIAIEALTHFSKAEPFEGVQNLHVEIIVPKRALNLEWYIDQNNAYQLRSAKFSAQDDLEIKASGSGRGTISVLTMYHRSSESGEDTCNLYTLNGDREATMSIVEVSLLTGFYPNQDDLKQLTSEVEMYAFQYETKTSSSDSTVVLYLEKVSHKEDTVLGFRVHRQLQAEFLQAGQVTIYDYYEPSRRCSAFYNLPEELWSLRKICQRDVCRCAEEQCPSLRRDSSRMKQSDLQVAACEAGVDFVYKVKVEGVEVAAANPYIYYNMQLLAIIKRGTDSARPLTRKKFVSHASCHDSLDLQEQETYLIMGQSSSLWRIKSNYTYVLGKETFLMHWPADEDVGKKELLGQLEEFSEYMHTHGCQS
ncbi:Complement C3 [Galemys pyrenaicus]|uniref:Complement C3 n=1 Tax=Galemys pyrenaicus TaxID=202257 RepID=A0A8J6AQ79_GALPY|nr:Complement C3 [Galemys pyrenaicus]